jgi:beta-glucosidase
MAEVDSAAHRALALEAAEKGVVILTNNNKALPLVAAELQLPGGLAVVGPNAMMKAYGNYNGDNNNYTTVLSGLQLVAPHVGYEHGCDVATTNTSGFAAAIKLAAASKVTVAVFGIDQSQEHETGTRTVLVFDRNVLPSMTLSFHAFAPLEALPCM